MKEGQLRGHRKQTQKVMEEKIIVDFLTEHWDAFQSLALEAGEYAYAGSQHDPSNVPEFLQVLLRHIQALRMRESGTVGCKSRDGEERQAHRQGRLGAEEAGLSGLLKKAQHMREFAATACEKASPIAVKNGLFVVNPQKSDEKLNDSFKRLVDSVLTGGSKS